MTSLVLFFADSALAEIVLIARIVIACLMVVASGFIIFVVMKQTGDSDGTEALSGSGSSRDRESYYGRNVGERRESKLKFWTYICAGALALLAVIFLILTAIVG